MLSWRAPKDNGGSPITGYEYQKRSENEKFDKTWTPIDGGGKIRETTVTDLENGVAYVNAKLKLPKSAKVKFPTCG